jgi:2-polyprenyl-3-methyl-5-hydroxy-6-metoxy-1,4-benzoquinol methylase
MKLIERKNSVIDNSCNFETLHTLNDFPVFMGCVDHHASEDLVTNQTWDICLNTGILQLKHLIPLDILYQSTHDAGAVGQIWMNHHASFAEFLHRFGPSSILEIGGAHGILSREYKRFGTLPWTILEPNPAPVEGCDARFIQGFFNDKFSYRESFDMVVHSHVFEHIYEPNKFMHHLADFISAGSHLIFSLPNIRVMLERKYTNGINFEHTILLTEPYVEYLLAKHGFRLLSKEYFMDDHSIFYATVRDPSVKPVELPDDLYCKNKKLYLDYVEYHEGLIKDVNRKIKNTQEPVYLFGAHVFAQYLIAFGLDASCIVSLLDNDSNKHGKRLYGTNLMVNSPKVLEQLENPIVILKAGVYNKEIKADILNNINNRVVFLE